MKARNGGRPHSHICYALTLLFALVGAIRAEAQTKAYVAHTSANLVTAIDTATGTVAGTIGVGAAPIRVAVTRDGTRAYVTNRDSDSISVIDTSVDTVIATIPVGDGPTHLAVTPDGSQLYVMTASGVVEVVDTTLAAVTATIPVGSSGDIAISPNGARAYVAAGLVYVIDTAANAVIKSFLPETAAVSGISNSASSVAFSPDGTRAYVGFVSTIMLVGFWVEGGVAVIDTASESVASAINLGELPGPIAVTPDGSRVYAAIQSRFVTTGYGDGFVPGTHIVVIDTITNDWAAIIIISDGTAGQQLNTAVSVVVAPDRRALYASVPRMGAVASIDVSANSVASLIPVTAGPGLLGVPGSTGVLVPYVMDAADDNSTLTTAGSTAVANVLANDRIGGFNATFAHVTLTEQSSTSEALALDSATGAVQLAAGAEIGIQSLVYRMCEIADPSNCDDATVTVTVLPAYVIDAVNDDGGVTYPNWTVPASVLANDTLGGTPATSARVTLSTVSSTAAGITLNAATGSVFVALGTAPGAHMLRYRICEIVDPANCDEADVSLTVNRPPIDAVNDSGLVKVGGTAVANVLANDKFANAVATVTTVRLSQLTSTPAGVSLNVATGAVTVAAGTPAGTHTLTYRICEITDLSNCDDASVSVTVLATPIFAGSDYARGSSKVANTVLASVLANDRLGGAAATLANVKLSFVSLTPANNMIRLDLTDGSVDVLRKTESGLYTLTYEICELAMLSNCARTFVKVDLSGR